jgi:hypothetical protein
VHVITEGVIQDVTKFSVMASIKTEYVMPLLLTKYEFYVI